VFKKSKATKKILLSKVLADLGYMGIDKICPNSKIPNKKTKLNPLTKEDKKENHKLSSQRIIIEQINAKVKVFQNDRCTYIVHNESRGTKLLHPKVPPDNNGSERAIRNIKVKLKVSGQFKSSQGAKDNATLKSVIDTARKREMNEFEVIRDVVSGESVF